MIDQRLAPWGALLLRVAMGIMFVAHAHLKAFVFGFPGAGKYFVSLGLPDWFVYPIVALETLGGLALIFGVYVRWVAVVMCVEILATIYYAQGSHGWVFSNKGGGWEFNALWAVGLVALAMIGDGALALVRSGGRESK